MNSSTCSCAKPPPTSVLKIGALGTPKCYVPSALGIDFGDPLTLELPATYSSSAPAGSYVFRYLSGAFDYDTDLTGDPADRYHDALEEFRRALQVRQGLGYRFGEVVNLHNIGDAWVRIGDIARAYASFEQSRELARESGWERGMVMNDVFLAYLRGLRGEDVTDALEKAGAAAARLGDREMTVQARWLLARLLQDRRDPNADRMLRAVESEAREAGLVGILKEMAGA